MSKAAGLAVLTDFGPHPSEAWIHPTDEDLSVGTPGMGHPLSQRVSGFVPE
jgi:hypothetical protein